MAMTCSRCGHVRETDADAWDCPHCGTTNRKAAAPPAKTPDAARRPPEAVRRPTERRTARRPDDVRSAKHGAAPTASWRDQSSPRPASVTITTTDTEFVAVYRWFSWQPLLLALAALAIAPLPLGLLPAPFGLALTVLLVVPTTYFVLVTLVNRTTIRATRTSLEARHGPIAIIGGDAMDAFGFWPDVRDVMVPASKLMWVAKAEREMIDLSSEESAQPAPTKVYLKAAFHDGVDVVEAQLLPSTAPDDVEDFIGWQLDGWLLRAALPFYKGAGSLTPDKA